MGILCALISIYNDCYCGWVSNNQAGRCQLVYIMDFTKKIKGLITHINTFRIEIPQITIFVLRDLVVFILVGSDQSLAAALSIERGWVVFGNLPSRRKFGLLY